MIAFSTEETMGIRRIELSTAADVSEPLSLRSRNVRNEELLRNDAIVKGTPSLLRNDGVS